ncbi:MAG TPA: hypothetical protein PK918_08470 [Methanotrichaceae archaeon]|nr:hypothetical protein [Methanotrichaceae archaeon]HQI92023.1 hypothetical protein [Methanotrichaceae archaeon]
MTESRFWQVDLSKAAAIGVLVALAVLWPPAGAVKMDSGFTFEMDQSVSGVGMISIYQNITDYEAFPYLQKANFSKAWLKRTVSGSGYYVSEDTVKVYRAYIWDSDAEYRWDLLDSPEDYLIHDRTRMEVKRNASMAYAGSKITEGSLSARTEQPWNEAEAARNVEAGLQTSYHFFQARAMKLDSIEVLDWDYLKYSGKSRLDAKVSGIGRLAVSKFPAEESPGAWQSEDNYNGGFTITRKISYNIKDASKETDDEAWLPCCYRGWSRLAKDRFRYGIGVDGIFGCACPAPA